MSFPRVPLRPDRLQNLRWSFPSTYAFARDRLTVPLINTEILRVAREYPIAFAQETEAWHPVAYLGDVDGASNRFVGADGGWIARYVPFWLRVYPFVRDGDAVLVILDPALVGVAGAHAFTDEAGALSSAAQDVSRQLLKADLGAPALREASGALVADGVAQVRPAEPSRAGDYLAFVAAAGSRELIGPRVAEWYARTPSAVELAIAAAFSNTFMPRVASKTVLLHEPQPAETPHPAAIQPLYVPPAAPADLDWLDTNEKIAF